MGIGVAAGGSTWIGGAMQKVMIALNGRGTGLACWRDVAVVAVYSTASREALVDPLNNEPVKVGGETSDG